MAYYSYLKTNRISHHGKKGMHWGVLNGPPYPIGSGPKKPMKEREAAARKRKADQNSVHGRGLKYTSLKKQESKAKTIRTLKRVATLGLYDRSLKRKIQNAFYDQTDYMNVEGDMEEVSELKRKKKQTITKEDMRQVNPRKNKYEPGTINNCINCSMAMEMRARGFDVRARKSAQGISTFSYIKFFPDIDIKHPRFEQKLNESRKSYVKRTYNDLCKEIEKNGEGSRGYVGIMYDKMYSGHSMYWTVNNGKVKFWDSQNNSTNTDHIFSLADPMRYSYARLDNLKVNAKYITEAVISTDKKSRRR